MENSEVGNWEEFNRMIVSEIEASCDPCEKCDGVLLCKDCPTFKQLRESEK